MKRARTISIGVLLAMMLIAAIGCDLGSGGSPSNGPGEADQTTNGAPVQAANTFDWSTVIVPAAIVIGASAIMGIFIWRSPGNVTKIRINVLWLATLVAVLTLTFGLKLIDVLTASGGQGSSTIEVVLSSLVGVGIGGLIAIAGQLVQDSGGSSGSE